MYQPNIFYYYVFGDKSYYKQCALSLFSLRKIGNFNGPVYIYAEDSNLIKTYLNFMSLEDNVIITELKYNRPLFGRYLAAIDLLKTYNFNVATYLDNDIIITSDVKNYLSFNEPSSFYIYEEKPPVQLLSYFTSKNNDKVLLANSGLFSFTLKTLNIFNKIMEQEKEYTDTQYNSVGDQPVFATVLSSESNINKTYLLNFEKLANSINMSSSLYFCFFHYNVGFKNKDKLNSLMDYFHTTCKQYNLDYSSILWKLLAK